MKIKQIVTFLQSVELFHNLQPERLNDLAKEVREVNFATGQVVSESSDGEPALFVLLEGECMEYVEQVELGMDAQSRRLYAGDFFGI